MTVSRPPIFSIKTRTDRSTGRHSESTFTFLDRIAGEHWEHPRQLMQEWANNLPEKDYHDLVQRLRSGDDEQFRSAFLELYLHQCLMRTGHHVTIHPGTSASSRQPDFYAERDGAGFFLEAISPGSSPAAKAAARRRAVLFDTVDKLDNQNFILSLERLDEGPKSPAAARLRTELGRWLNQLDPDASPDWEQWPEWTWESEGWLATFRAIPTGPSARRRGGDQRAIGIYAHRGASFINDAPGIRKALAGKHHVYGDLGAPFVVAVGTYIFDRDRWHSLNAMYGQLAVEISRSDRGQTALREVRRPDGYFGGPPEWRHRHVSAVLLVNQLMPYSVPRADTTLWLHPRPLHALPDSARFPGAVISMHDGALQEAAPISPPGSLFGLTEPWPPGEAWPRG